MNIEQLEINVNLYAMRQDFLNLELHYVIAANENTFRFATWSDEPKGGEQKYYCFLSENELFIPAGGITLKQSYVLKEEPEYRLIANVDDFIDMLGKVSGRGVGKGIRQFGDSEIDSIKDSLCTTYGDCEKHIVRSAEAQHLLFVVKNIEISISATMVYFRQKAEFSEPHYEHVKEE